MAKKRQFTQEDMEKIEQLYQETTLQSKVLNEILLCLKGSDSMNIEGVIPAQRRIENVIENKLATKQEILEISTEVKGMQETLRKLNDWKQIVSIYMGLFMSKRMWRGVVIFVAVVMVIILSIKYGFQNVWHYIKGLFL